MAARTRREPAPDRPAPRNASSTVYQVHRSPRLAEDADKLLDEAGRRLKAIEQAVDAAMLDGAIDVPLGAFVLDMTTKTRRFVEAATHRGLVGVS